MLLFLDRDLVTALPQLVQRADFRYAFENIATARREGYHVILGDYRVISALSSADALSPLAKAIYKRIAIEAAQIGALLSLVETHINVSIAGTGGLPAHKGIQVSLTSLATLEAINPVRLIGENLDDCKFYKFLGQSYAAGSLASGLPLACQFISGGGADTPKAYAHYKPLAGTTLAIVDSDKRCPDDALGDVAKGIQHADQNTAGIGRTVVLNSKGVENLIPLPLFQVAFDEGWTCELGSQGIKDLHEGSREVRFYSDLKNGVSQYKLLSWPIASPRHQFWNPKYKGVRNKFGAFDPRCDHAIRCDDADDCDCWVVKKIGGHALSQAVKATSVVKPSQVWRKLDADLKGEWERIGKTVVSWCCGMSRISAP